MGISMLSFFNSNALKRKRFNFMTTGAQDCFKRG